MTDLPNRALFDDRLNQAIVHARREHKIVSVLFLDLDKFKLINDTHGHLVGDKLLRAVATRLSESVRETDTVCRLGGDEFVILLGDLDNEKAAEAIARKILANLNQPIILDEMKLVVSTSIGIAYYPGHADETEALIKSADTAMYNAKTSGRNAIRIYEHSATLN